jgi:hypothetical protein
MSTVWLQNEKPDWSGYAAWRELIRRRLMAAFAAYRPELHYMRGQEPMWREKSSRFSRGPTDSDALSSGPFRNNPAFWWLALGGAT